jgi:hypothetical protein
MPDLDWAAKNEGDTSKLAITGFCLRRADRLTVRRAQLKVEGRSRVVGVWWAQSEPKNPIV